jgi:hypothetical protein
LEGLEQQTIHALSQRTDSCFNSAKTGHDQYGNIRLYQLRAGYDIETIHFRHADINQQQINMLLLKMFDRFTRVSQ